MRRVTLEKQMQVCADISPNRLIKSNTALQIISLIDPLTVDTFPNRGFEFRELRSARDLLHTIINATLDLAFVI